jgi:hypothetical protein
MPDEYHQLFPANLEGLLFADRFVSATTAQEQESVLGILELRKDGIR